MIGHGKPWTDAERRASIERDLIELHAERLVALQRKDRDHGDEVRGMELQYAARADADRCDEEVAALDEQIDEQFAALQALPKPRETT